MKDKRLKPAPVYSLYMRYIIYFTAIGLTPGGSGTVNIYTQYTEYRDGTYITLKIN
jgi:hypothetical protein